MSLGAEWSIKRTNQHYQFSDFGTDGAAGLATTDQYNASDSLVAAYTTVQKSIGSLTVEPGLRMEDDSRRVSSPVVRELRIERTGFFPSLHLKYSLAKALDITASYSKRVDRTPLEYLRPYRMIENAATIFQGNPDLKDQSTSAYELNLHYHVGSIDIGTIIYHRETRDLWSKSYLAEAKGVNVYTYINSGNRRDSGIEVDLGAPVMKHIKTNLILNVFDQRTPLDPLSGFASNTTFRYSTNGSIQWGGPDRGYIPGDVVQLQWTYASPSRTYELRDLAWVEGILSYTRSFSPSLSLTSSLQVRAPNRERLFAPLLQEYDSTQRNAELKIKLLKILGKR